MTSKRPREDGEPKVRKHDPGSVFGYKYYEELEARRVEKYGEVADVS